MPAINLTTIPTIPYVYSGTTSATANIVQIINVPTIPGVTIMIHNREKATKSLRISFDPALTDGGAAPAMFFTIESPLQIKADTSAQSGFQPSAQLAIFSAHTSTAYELLFLPT